MEKNKKKDRILELDNQPNPKKIDPKLIKELDEKKKKAVATNQTVKK